MEERNKMKNRFFSLAALIAAVICASFICTDLCGAEKVKYVFVLIGDGFGPNQRAVGEAANGKKLAMNTLPVATPTGTNCVQGWTTDSAASGTAIACGVKTYNGAIGVDKDKKPLVSLAKDLKKKGFAIGIVSTCALTDATPAAQYANQELRSMRKEIAGDMAKCDFDFFAGGNLSNCNEDPDHGKNEKNMRAIIADSYTIVTKPGDVKNDGKKYFLTNPPHTCWPYCGKHKSRLTLAQYLEKTIDVLMKKNENGFYIMLECGRIDHAGHNNDAAKTAREVISFDKAISVALDFQKKHPEETLVIITADHETGGLQIEDKAKLEKRAPELLKQYGKKWVLASVIGPMIKAKKPADAVVKELVKRIGCDDFTKEEIKILEGLVETNYANPKTKIRRFDARSIVNKACEFRDAKLGLKYTTGGHSSTKIITNVIGPGCETFKRDDLENSSLKGLIEAIIK